MRRLKKNKKINNQYPLNRNFAVSGINRFRSVCYVWIVIWILLTAGGCELFRTREAEEPIGEVEWNYFPITAEQTKENLEFAYRYNQNIDRYGSILSNDFRFFFDHHDIQDYSLPENWDRQAEINMRSMLSREMDITLTKIDEKEDVIQAETVTYYRDYATTTNDVAGSMTLYLRREADGFWKIYRWEDYRKDNYISWGRLKYEFGPQS